MPKYGSWIWDYGMHLIDWAVKRKPVLDLILCLVPVCCHVLFLVCVGRGLVWQIQLMLDQFHQGGSRGLRRAGFGAGCWKESSLWDPHHTGDRQRPPIHAHTWSGGVTRCSSIRVIVTQQWPNMVWLDFISFFMVHLLYANQGKPWKIKHC